MSGADAELRHSPLQRRQAGVLLHPTSLPGPGPHGDLGVDAYHFVDFLANAGQQVWQILPLGPTHGDGSPYQCLSVHAGNPDLVDLRALVANGWLSAATLEAAHGERETCFAEALAGFKGRAEASLQAQWEQFQVDNAHWLDDFADYSVIKQRHGGQPWNAWPVELRDRDLNALNVLRRYQAESRERVAFEQFLFHRQWLALKGYANEQGITIFGDMPIFVAYDSADVWAHRECFLLDERGEPTVVAGVPPDYFSETGQRWGNPHYDWEWMAADGFTWWQARMETQLKLFDLVRIDHFRGFEAYWEVPAEAQTAMDGRWVEAPGDALFGTLRERFDPLPVVAEDLGIITDAVEALRRKYALPGMKILQFAFGGGADNPYLPHNHEPNSVVYTGTHDNDTTLGWYQAQGEGERVHVEAYLGYPEEAQPWPLIRSAYRSVARLAVVPMQDLLALESDHRMNVPGTTEGNWRWRFAWDWLPEGLAERLRGLSDNYGRR